MEDFLTKQNFFDETKNIFVHNLWRNTLKYLIQRRQNTAQQNKAAGHTSWATTTD